MSLQECDLLARLSIAAYGQQMAESRYLDIPVSLWIGYLDDTTNSSLENSSVVVGGQSTPKTLEMVELATVFHVALDGVFDVRA